MKKMLALFACALLLCMTIAHAEDLGVQVIGGQNAAPEVLTLDDMQLGERYEIDGYARVLPVKFEFQDYFVQYDKGFPGDNTYTQLKGSDWRDTSAASGYLVRNHELWSGWAHHYWYFDHIKFAESGKSADFGMLYVDLVNLRMTPHAFMQDATVTIVFDDEYSFSGWIRQYNDDYCADSLYGDYQGTYYPQIQPDDEEAIDMLYTGRYVFGCTLPLEVVNGTEPLRMEIELGDSELTYHIRK